MPFGIIGRTGPGMRQVVSGLGIGRREGVLLGANLGRAIVTNGDFTAYVCDSAATRPLPKLLWANLLLTLSVSIKLHKFTERSVVCQFSMHSIYLYHMTHLYTSGIFSLCLKTVFHLHM